MKRVIIESPYRGENYDRTELNVKYARACGSDCFNRNEAPFASHLLYTQMLDDTIPRERDLGIKAGLLYGRITELTAVYYDMGISEGMVYGINAAREAMRAIELRALRGEWEKYTPLETRCFCFGNPLCRLCEGANVIRTATLHSAYERVLIESGNFVASL